MGRQHGHALCAAAAESRPDQSTIPLYHSWRVAHYQGIDRGNLPARTADDAKILHFREQLPPNLSSCGFPVKQGVLPCRQGGDGPRNEASSRRGTPAQQPQPSVPVWGEPQTLAALHPAPPGQLRESGDLNKAASRGAAGSGAELGPLDLGPRRPISQVGRPCQWQAGQVRGKTTLHGTHLLLAWMPPNKLHRSSPPDRHVTWPTRLPLCPCNPCTP